MQQGGEGHERSVNADSRAAITDGVFVMHVIECAVLSQESQILPFESN